ncbi:MAG: hypothetical protein CM15mV24_1530 [Bellamyvirus sp.]|nr:MAG: hypothetical protein CM15mV24_1530 [Bellamyvirus sp.]
MSCNVDIDVKLNIHEAMLIREFCSDHTKQDSYEFPSQRTVVIRNFIHQLDEQIEANLPEDHDH